MTTADKSPHMGAVEIRPAVNRGEEAQPTLSEEGALGLVQVKVEDDHGLLGDYRLEVVVFPNGHGGASGDLVLLGAWRVAEDGSGGERPDGDAEMPVAIGPVPESTHEVMMSFTPRLSRLVAHQGATGKVYCLMGCSDAHYEGLSPGDPCPECGAPTAAVTAPDGKTCCPVPCGMVLYDAEAYPAGAPCPACLERKESGEEMPKSAFAGLMEVGDEDEDEDLDGAGEDEDEDEEVEAALFEAMAQVVCGLAEAESSDVAWALTSVAQEVVEVYGLHAIDDDEDDDEDDDAAAN